MVIKAANKARCGNQTRCLCQKGDLQSKSDQIECDRQFPSQNVIDSVAWPRRAPIVMLPSKSTTVYV